MNRHRKLLIGSLASAAVVGSGLLMPTVFAKAASNNSTSLISELATKFNLKESDVKAVFDQHKTEMDAGREAKEAERLTQAVTDGKITSAQKDLIIAKQKEMKAAMDAQRDSGSTMTEAERKTAREKTQADLKAWASQNSIDLKWLGGPGGHGGPGGPRGNGDGPPPADSAGTTAQ